MPDIFLRLPVGRSGSGEALQRVRRADIDWEPEEPLIGFPTFWMGSFYETWLFSTGSGLPATISSPTHTPSRKVTLRPEMAGMRSPVTTIPTRFKGSAAAI